MTTYTDTRDGKKIISIASSMVAGSEYNDIIVKMIKKKQFKKFSRQNDGTIYYSFDISDTERVLVYANEIISDEEASTLLAMIS